MASGELLEIMCGIGHCEWKSPIFPTRLSAHSLFAQSYTKEYKKGAVERTNHYGMKNHYSIICASCVYAVCIFPKIPVKVIRMYFNFLVKNAVFFSRRFYTFFIFTARVLCMENILRLVDVIPFTPFFPYIIQRNNAYEKLLCVVRPYAEHKFDSITQNRLK